MDEDQKNPRVEATQLFLWIAGISVRNAAAYLREEELADFDTAFLHALRQKRDLILEDHKGWLPLGGKKEFLDLVAALEKQVLDPTDLKKFLH